MAEILDDVSYLSREIGPRPAGTEEEQQSALYIADQVHKRTGFHAEIEDIKCMANADLVRLIYLAIAFVCLLLAFLLPTTSIVTGILSLVGAILFVMEMWLKRPIFSRFLTRDISQNVVVKYTPAAERTRTGSPRKIVVVANYDSGRVRREVRSGLIGAYTVFAIAASICVVATPILIVLRNIILAGSTDVAGAILSLLCVIALVILGLSILVMVLRRFAAYNEGANNNASSVAAMLEVLRRIDGTAAPVGAPHTRAPHEHEAGEARVHGKDAAYKAGVVPEGASLSYDDDVIPEDEEAAAAAEGAAEGASASAPENAASGVGAPEASVSENAAPQMPEQGVAPIVAHGASAVAGAAAAAGLVQGADSAADRLRSAKAAIAALTGEAVSNNIYLDLDAMPAPAPTPSERAANAVAPAQPAAEQAMVGAADAAPETAGAASEVAPQADAASETPSASDVNAVANAPAPEPVPVAPVYEAPRPTGEPAWFTAARAKANRKAEVPAKRSKYAEALDAAVKEPEADAHAGEPHVDEATEERLRQLRESFGAQTPAANAAEAPASPAAAAAEASPSTTASFAPVGRQGETAAFDVDFDMGMEKPPASIDGAARVAAVAPAVSQIVAPVDSAVSAVPEAPEPAMPVASQAAEPVAPVPASVVAEAPVASEASSEAETFANEQVEGEETLPADVASAAPAADGAEEAASAEAAQDELADDAADDDFEVLDAELVEIIDEGEYAEDEFAAYDDEDADADFAPAASDDVADEAEGNSVASKIGGFFSNLRETVMPSNTKEDDEYFEDDADVADDSAMEQGDGASADAAQDEEFDSVDEYDYDEDYEEEPSRISDLRERMSGAFSRLKSKLAPAPNYEDEEYAYDEQYEDDTEYFEDEAEEAVSEEAATDENAPVMSAAPTVPDVSLKNGETGEMPPVVAPEAQAAPAAPSEQPVEAAVPEAEQAADVYERPEQTMFIDEPMEVEEPDDSLINQATAEASEPEVAADEAADQVAEDVAGDYAEEAADQVAEDAADEYAEEAADQVAEDVEDEYADDEGAYYEDESYDYDEYDYEDERTESPIDDLKQRVVGIWNKLTKRSAADDEYDYEDEYSGEYYEDEYAEDEPQEYGQVAVAAQGTYQTAYGPSYTPVTSINVNYKSPEPLDPNAPKPPDVDDFVPFTEETIFEDAALVEDRTNQQVAVTVQADEDYEPPIAVAPVVEQTPASPANPRVERAGRYESTVAAWEEPPADEQVAFAEMEAAVVDEDPSKTAAMAPIDVSAFMKAGAAGADVAASTADAAAGVDAAAAASTEEAAAGAAAGVAAATVAASATAKPATIKPKPHLSAMLPRIELGDAAPQTTPQGKSAAPYQAPENEDLTHTARLRRLRTSLPSMSGTISNEPLAAIGEVKSDVEKTGPFNPVHTTGAIDGLGAQDAGATQAVRAIQEGKAVNGVPAASQQSNNAYVGVSDVIDAAEVPGALDAVDLAPAEDAYQGDYDYTWEKNDRSFEQAQTPEPQAPETHHHHRFGRWRSHKEEISSPQEWLGVADDFDARAVGKARGDWSSFRPDDERAGVGDRGASQSTMGWRADRLNPDPVNDYDTGIDSAFNSEEDDFLDEDTGLNNGRWMGGAFSGRRDVQRDRYEFDDTPRDRYQYDDAPRDRYQYDDAPRDRYQYDDMARDRYQYDDEWAEYSEYADENYTGTLPAEDDYADYPEDDYAAPEQPAAKESIASRFRHRSARGEAEERTERSSRNEPAEERRAPRTKSSLSEDDAWNIAAARAAERSAVADALSDPLVQEEIGETYGFVDDAIANEVWFVALGAGLSDNVGMESFLDEHADELRGAIVINLEGIGDGDLAGMASEGLLRRFKTTTRMKRFLRNAGQATGVKVGQARMNWRDSAATVAMRRGMSAITIAGMDGAVPMNYGSQDDVVENLSEDTLKQRVNFILELLRAI